MRSKKREQRTERRGRRRERREDREESTEIMGETQTNEKEWKKIVCIRLTAICRHDKSALHLQGRWSNNSTRKTDNTTPEELSGSKQMRQNGKTHYLKHGTERQCMADTSKECTTENTYKEKGRDRKQT